MNARISGLVFVGIVFTSTAAFAQTQPPTRGPAENGSPAWFLQGSFQDPGGNTVVDAAGRVTIGPRGGGGTPAAAPTRTATPMPPTPSCSRSPVCGNRLTPGRQS